MAAPAARAGSIAVGAGSKARVLTGAAGARATASAAARASASVAVPAVTTVVSAGARASASSAALVDTRVMNSIVASVDRIAIDTIAGGRAGRKATGLVRAGSMASASTAVPAATM